MRREIYNYIQRQIKFPLLLFQRFVKIFGRKDCCKLVTNVSTTCVEATFRVKSFLRISPALSAFHPFVFFFFFYQNKGEGSGPPGPSSNILRCLLNKLLFLVLLCPSSFERPHMFFPSFVSRLRHKFLPMYNIYG